MMKLIAHRDGDALHGDDPMEPGVIYRPDGSSYNTTVSVAAVLRGYGWAIVKDTDTSVKQLWGVS